MKKCRKRERGKLGNVGASLMEFGCLAVLADPELLGFKQQSNSRFKGKPPPIAAIKEDTVFSNEFQQQTEFQIHQK